MTATRMDWTPEQYHTDPNGPSLSSSIAHTLITRSPLHAWAEHPKLGNIQRRSTKEQDMGSIIHSVLLGKGAPLCVLNFDNYRTGAARKERDEAIEAGQTPVLSREYDEIIEISQHLFRGMEAEGVKFDPGESEVAVEFTEPGIDGPVLCRRMMDRVNFETGRVIELKTITRADERTCNQHAYQFGYDIAAAATISAMTQLLPDLAGRIEVEHVFFEKSANEKPPFKPPYVVVRRFGDGAFEELGQRRWDRAVKLWEGCLRDGQWPSYPPAPLSVPGWAVPQEESEL